MAGYLSDVVSVPADAAVSSETGARHAPGTGRGGEDMKKKFRMQDLDCAHCAAKMEEAIKKVEGVNDASISFMTQKLMVDAEESRFDDIMDEIVKICRKVEPDCRILI